MTRIWLTLVTVLISGPVAAKPTASEVRFESQGIELAGELVLPRSRSREKLSRIPAVIVVHGSGKNDRMNWSEQTGFFLKHGFAIFRFDKRGGGKSQGDWTQASMQDLAKDIDSAWRRVSKMDAIDPKKIGIWGGSQGFAVGAVSAVQNDKLAFAILASGYVGPLWDQDDYRFVSEMRRKSIGESEIGKYKHARALMKKFVQTSTGYEDLKKLFHNPTFRKILPYLTPNGELFPRDHPGITYWRKNVSFDVRKYVPDIKIPVLAIWGGKDDGVDAVDARKQFNSLVTSKCGATHIFPSADHGIYYRKEPGPGWAKKENRELDSKYEATVIKWVDKVTKNSQKC